MMSTDSVLLSGDDIEDYRLQRFFKAYIRMANDARVRMAAPSDGLGNVQLSEAELEDPQVLRDEALRYAERMYECDEKTSYDIAGCVHGEWALALAYTFEATKLMCAGGNSRPIEQLLQMAIDEIRNPTP
jgi:hypothetical protein